MQFLEVLQLPALLRLHQRVLGGHFSFPFWISADAVISSTHSAWINYHMNPCESCRQLSCTWFAAIDVSQDWYLPVSPPVWFCCFLFCVRYLCFRQRRHASKCSKIWTFKAWATMGWNMSAESMSYFGNHHCVRICRKHATRAHVNVYPCYGYISYGCIMLYLQILVWSVHMICIPSDSVCTRMIMLMYIWCNIQNKSK